MVMSPVEPVLSVFTGKTNGALLAEAARLWMKPDDILMDVTWGEGKWHTQYQHPGTLIKHDRYKLDGVDFCELPEEDASVDVVWYDPPYVTTGNRATSTVDNLYDRYGLGVIKGYCNLMQVNSVGLMELYRVLKPRGRLFCKSCNYIESGKFCPGHTDIVSSALLLGFTQVDEMVHVTGTGPQPRTNLDGSPRRQVHSRRAHSFLSIFER